MRRKWNTTTVLVPIVSLVERWSDEEIEIRKAERNNIDDHTTGIQNTIACLLDLWRLRLPRLSYTV